ncbi:MAG: adenylate/guanylate cyclase domain-containing protein [Candidatus Gracilibacteria bacterium]|nr:adenylate/guanylate cyclase domain-containing protein [Candidatus Gracilibacteria bacterium]
MSKTNDFLNRKLNLNNKFFISIFISVSVIVVILFLKAGLFGDIFTRVNLTLQNELYTERVAYKKNQKPIITVIEIDDRTLEDSDKGGLGRWQDFKREYYAKVIDRLKQDGAIVIGADILFSEKQDPKNDAILKDSFEKAGNVILASQAISKLYPIETFTESSSGIGDVLPTVNRYNNMVYSIKPFFNFKGDIIKSFSIMILDRYYREIYGEKKNITEDDLKSDFVNFYGVNIPYLKNNRELFINYSANNNFFNRVSFLDIYNGDYDKDMIKDKIILIGSTALGLHDEFNTPFGIMPGVYTHANAINTILNKKVIFFIDFQKELLVLVLFIFLITLLGVHDIFGKLHKFYFIISLFFLIVVYFKVYNFIFITYNTIFSSPVYFFISIFLSFIFVSLYRYIYEDKGKRILKDALSQYLAKDLVDTVLNDYKKIDLNGDKKDITIFFSDIAGFTSLSENLEPHELMDFLKRYLKEVSDVIINNKGFINKYEGDAVMALWGTFSNEKYQVYNTCKAALEQQKIIESMKDELMEKYGFELSVRMGINKGEAIVGNIGSLGNKIEYTAIGDNVNIASRLESINKHYGTKICVSESIVNQLKELVLNGDNADFIFRKLDIIKVKGKKKSLMIYELVGYRNEVSSEMLDLIRKFELGLDMYFQKEFIKAKDIFLKLKVLGDNVSDVFFRRCETFIKNPSEENDPIWEFSEK